MEVARLQISTQYTVAILDMLIISCMVTKVTVFLYNKHAMDAYRLSSYLVTLWDIDQLYNE